MSPLLPQILYADDSDDDCKLFSFILTEAGYDVKSAQSLKEALQLIEVDLFQVCVFDLSLKDGTGFELLQYIRAINPSIPAIICSGDARDSTRQHAMVADVQAFFTKPIDYDLLVATIAELIE